MELICCLCDTIRWIDVRISPQLWNIHGINDVRQTEIQIAEPWVPEPNAFETDIAIEKLKRYKPPHTDQIPAECSEIHDLINSVWNKEQLPQQWKENIIVYIFKTGGRTDCNNYRGISLLPTAYKILSNILVSRLISYAGKVTWDHQCEFGRDRSTTDQIFCIRRTLEKWE